MAFDNNINASEEGLSIIDVKSKELDNQNDSEGFLFDTASIGGSDAHKEPRESISSSNEYKPVPIAKTEKPVNKFQ
jgi:hypothetical protein